MKQFKWSHIALLIFSLIPVFTPAAKRCSDLAQKKGGPNATRFSVLEDLKRGRTQSLSHGYLEIIDLSGAHSFAKFIAQSRVNGKLEPKVMLLSGEGTRIPLDQVQDILVSPESRDRWLQLESKVRKSLRNQTLLEGDLQFLTIPSSEAKDGVDWVRVVGFEKNKGKMDALVLYPDGSLVFRTEDQLASGYPSEKAKALWLGFDHQGKLRMSRKSYGEVGLSRAEWIQRALGHSEVSPVALKKARPIKVDEVKGKLLDQALGDTPVARMGQALKEKLGVFLTTFRHPEEHWQGIFINAATLTDEFGLELEDQMVIKVSDGLLETGKITDTEIHELGHVQTMRNLERGIPDPLGIEFEALSKRRRLPDGTDYGINEEDHYYSEFSSADESRQYAYNLHHAVHQRATKDVIQDFNHSPILPASKVYGFNLANFFESMEAAMDRIEDVLIFNKRNRELALAGIEEIQSAIADPRRLLTQSFEVLSGQAGDPARFVIKTKKSFIYIPIVGPAYQRILSPLEFQHAGETHFNFSIRKESIPELLDYASVYLSNLIQAMDRQEHYIRKVIPEINELAMEPNREVTLKKYLEFQGNVMKIKTSVNVKPEWLGGL
jgi:hypothetical protein